jgi:uncharacterized membrane protein YagU involved in acid resistance
MEMSVVNVIVYIAIIVGVVYGLKYVADHSPAPAPAPELVAAGPRPATLIRIYRGRNQPDAVERMAPDAAALADDGYIVTAQSWAQGSYGCGAFLVALILFIVFIGLLVFLYMLLVKPDGTLTVTYTLRTESPLTPDPSLAVTDQLKKLGELRDAGVLTTEEFEAKKAELLARL